MYLRLVGLYICYQDWIQACRYGIIEKKVIQLQTLSRFKMTPEFENTIEQYIEIF